MPYWAKANLIPVAIGHMEQSYVIIGGGGHAMCVADALQQLELPVLGYTAPANQGELVPGIAWLGLDTALQQLPPERIRLVNGIGSVGTGMAARRDAYLRLREQGYHFANFIHPAASVSPLLTSCAPGNQVMAGAVISPDVSCGENVLVNTRAIVEHGCRIGDHCHIASGAVLCGEVQVADGVHIGAGATIVQGLKIGTGAVIAAGAVITENVEPLTLVAGVPGKIKRKIQT